MLSKFDLTKTIWLGAKVSIWKYPACNCFRHMMPVHLVVCNAALAARELNSHRGPHTERGRIIRERILFESGIT